MGPSYRGSSPQGHTPLELLTLSPTGVTEYLKVPSQVWWDSLHF